MPGSSVSPIFPSVLADVTRDGGYPPLMIDPIDFVSLYQQRREQMAQEIAETKQPN